MKTTPTERMLAEMLVENTGRHFLDSGSAYGRNWERNQGLTVKDWIASKPVTIDKFGTYSVNVFHYLRERVDYLKRIDTIFQDYQSQERFNDSYYPSIIEEFLEELNATGIYGEGSPTSVNTYNGESNLSQVLQFWVFNIDNDTTIKIDGKRRTIPADSYVLLQIHGGCDVRGGYTKPRLFRLPEDDSMFDNNRAYLSCEGTVQPVDVIEGQETLDGNVVNRTAIHHDWESDNGGYEFVLDGVWGYSQKMMVLGEDSYQAREGRAIAATWDEDREVWLCPIDHTPLNPLFM